MSPQPPASSFALSVAVAGLGLKLPVALETLYKWHNGIFHLNAFLHFLPLREAAKLYLVYSDCRSKGWEPVIEASWFPVLDQNGDIQYCIDVENRELWTVDLEDGSTQKLARDYETYLDALIAAFERGLVVFDPDRGCFDIEPDERESLCREFELEAP
jgi:hypothetical protein